MRMPVIIGITALIITVIIIVTGIITINPIVNIVAQMVMVIIAIMVTEDTIDRATIHIVTDIPNRGITDTSLIRPRYRSGYSVGYGSSGGHIGYSSSGHHDSYVPLAIFGAIAIGHILHR